eukprot:416907_1
MSTPERNEYSLRMYYGDYLLSAETRDLVANLPAWITDDPTEYCHYYIQSNNSILNTKTINIKNTDKYSSRTQKIFNQTTKENDSITNKQSPYSATISRLRAANPSIKIIKEKTLINTIKPFIDTRCDEILKQNDGEHKDDISYFLMDNNGVFDLDNGYHTKNLSQFHFGGDYGPNYQGPLFVNPQKYKLQKSLKKNKKNINMIIKEKTCNGCCTKYMDNEWETHIKTDAHQQYLRDPRMTVAKDYFSALNERLLKAPPVQKNNTFDDVFMFPNVSQEQKCDSNDMIENNNNKNIDNHMGMYALEHSNNDNIDNDT